MLLAYSFRPVRHNECNDRHTVLPWVESLRSNPVFWRDSAPHTAVFAAWFRSGPRCLPGRVVARIARSGSGPQASSKPFAGLWEDRPTKREHPTSRSFRKAAAFHRVVFHGNRRNPTSSKNTNTRIEKEKNTACFSIRDAQREQSFIAMLLCYPTLSAQKHPPARR